MKVEKVLKKLQRNGYCVSLIDNDRGEWAATYIRLDFTPEPEDAEVTYHGKIRISSSVFRPTIKGAIRAFLRINKIDIQELE